MAITATIVVTPASGQINQPYTAALNIANSGGADVTVESLTPLVRMTGSSDPTTYNAGFAVSNPFNAQGLTVPAGGSLDVSFQVVPFAPSTGPRGTGSGTFDVLAEIRTSDGAETRPTADTIEVDPLPDTQPND